MARLYEMLMEDVRFAEGMKACMNCGICTAICPAAEFYDYDPRNIVDIVQQHDETTLRELLKSDTIWYCGQCMSCKTRCPRGNVPGLIIMSLRYLSQKLGYFIESEKGRQQFAIKRTVGDNILKKGYCVHPEAVIPACHPEQGPVWEWIFRHIPDVYDRLGGNFDKEGPGAVRKIPEATLKELRDIFEVSGGMELFRKIEAYSKIKADEMGLDVGEGTESDYFHYTYTYNSRQKPTE